MSEDKDPAKFEFDKDPKTLNDEDLVSSHSLMHRFWNVKRETGEAVLSGKSRSNEDLINYHALIIQEMMGRGFSHESKDDFDEATAPFLKGEIVPIEIISDDGNCFEKGVGQPFGSPAGKWRVAKRLIEMIPPHKRYIEPFCGGASVFFAKEQSEEEILCDADPDIIAALRFLQTMKPADLTRLKRFNWTTSRKRFDDVKGRAPQDRVERFYRFKYLRRFSFNNNSSSWAPSEEGYTWSNFDRLEKAGERLKNVELICGNGCTVMAKRSTDNTIMFLDPPYWHKDVAFGEDKMDSRDFDDLLFKKALYSAKGRWLMTLMTLEAAETKSRWRRKIIYWHSAPVGQRKELKKRGEWLLANYDVGKIEKASTLATVNPSGVKLGEPVHLSEVLPFLKSYKVRSPYIYLVGGLAIHGKTEGDIDILIKDDCDVMDPRLKKILEWRIMRMLHQKFWKRVQFHYDRFFGPFTDNIPLFDFTLERVNQENKVFEMSLEKQARAATPEVQRDIEASVREDKIKMFRMFLPQKPVKVGPEGRQTVESFLNLFEPDDFPVFSSKKFDSARHIIFRQGERVEIWSEDGSNNTTRFPSIAEAVKKLKEESLVLDSEIEMWVEGDHKPREAVDGYLSAKTPPDDTNLVANVFDCLLFGDEDIHKRPQAERLALLAGLGFPQIEIAPDPKKGLNLVKHLKADNIEALERQMRIVSEYPGSEGNVGKLINGRYWLDGNSRDAWVEYHKAATLFGVVIEAIETATKGVFNYRYGISISKKYKPKKALRVGGIERWEVGKTFSSAKKARIGDVIEVEIEKLNFIEDRKDGTWEISGFSPRLISITDRKEPSTPEEAVAAAEEEDLLQEKVITEEEMTIYKQADPFLAYPKEGVKYGYVIGHHRRGKSNHSDFRVESLDKDFLIGWTMADMIAGAEKESTDDEARKALDLPPEEEMTEAQKDRWIRKMFSLAQERDGERKNFKIDWETGRFQMRETQAGTIVPAQLRAFRKAREPKAWLTVEGVTPPFPAPGATKEFRGVFTILDGTQKHGGNAWVEYGRQAPQFHEYFLFGGTIKGRLVFRQLAREALRKGCEDEELGKQLITLPTGTEEAGEAEELLWTAIQPLDQTPQFLTKRAVDTGAMPPLGKSGLPEVVKAEIPSELRYWKEKTLARAKKIRDELVENIKTKEVEMDFNKLLGVPEIEKALDEFILLWQWWKGPELVRAAPSRQQWYIVTRRAGKLAQWTFGVDPLKTDKASGTLDLEPEKTIWTIEGEVEPSTPLNPTTETPSFVERLDSGSVTILEDGDVFKKYEFRGKEFKGLWIAQRSSPQDAIWRFERSTEVATGGGDSS